MPMNISDRKYYILYAVRQTGYTEGCDKLTLEELILHSNLFLIVVNEKGEYTKFDGNFNYRNIFDIRNFKSVNTKENIDFVYRNYSFHAFVKKILYQQVNNLCSKNNVFKIPIKMFSKVPYGYSLVPFFENEEKFLLFTDLSIPALSAYYSRRNMFDADTVKYVIKYLTEFIFLKVKKLSLLDEDLIKNFRFYELTKKYGILQENRLILFNYFIWTKAYKEYVLKLVLDAYENITGHILFLPLLLEEGEVSQIEAVAFVFFLASVLNKYKFNELEDFIANYYNRKYGKGFYDKELEKINNRTLQRKNARKVRYYVKINNRIFWRSADASNVSYHRSSGGLFIASKFSVSDSTDYIDDLLVESPILVDRSHFVQSDFVKNLNSGEELWAK